MSQENIEPLKDQVVARLSDLAPPGWKSLFLDYETQEVQSRLVCSPAAVAVVKRLMRAPEKVDLDIATDLSLSKAAEELAAFLMRSNGTKCVTIDVIVRSNGKHWWHFDFSPPLRVTATLNGDLTAEYREPLMRKPYLRFARQDEWLAQID